MKTAEFTDLELSVLKCMYQSMKGNGFDFGFLGDCRPEGVSAKSAGAVLRGLRKKVELWSDEYDQVGCSWAGGSDGGCTGDSPLHWEATFEEFLAKIRRTAAAVDA